MGERTYAARGACGSCRTAPTGAGSAEFAPCPARAAMISRAPPSPPIMRRPRGFCAVSHAQSARSSLSGSADWFASAAPPRRRIYSKSSAMRVKWALNLGAAFSVAKPFAIVPSRAISARLGFPQSTCLRCRRKGGCTSDTKRTTCSIHGCSLEDRAAHGAFSAPSARDCREQRRPPTISRRRSPATPGDFRSANLRSRPPSRSARSPRSPRKRQHPPLARFGRRSPSRRRRACGRARYQ